MCPRAFIFHATAYDACAAHPAYRLMAFVEEPARFCPDTAHLLLSAGPTIAHKEIGVHISERLLYDLNYGTAKSLTPVTLSQHVKKRIKYVYDLSDVTTAIGSLLYINL
jgi:hypothetical protein